MDIGRTKQRAFLAFHLASTIIGTMIMLLNFGAVLVATSILLVPILLIHLVLILFGRSHDLVTTLPMIAWSVAFLTLSLIRVDGVDLQTYSGLTALSVVLDLVDRPDTDTFSWLPYIGFLALPALDFWAFDSVKQD